MSLTRTIIYSSTGADRDLWVQAWEKTGREPFAHPAYVELFMSEGEEAFGVVVENGAGMALVPVVVRPIPGDHGQPSEGTRALRDAISPYGYGGPYGSAEVARDGAWAGVAQWMTTNKIVSLFGRLSLDAPAPVDLPPGATLDSESENVVVDLTRPQADQWRHYAHKVRKNVKRAMRAGIHVEVKESFTDLEEFWHVYESTMVRREANPWYRFSQEFFDALAQDLAGSFLVAEARDTTGHLVSVELVLCSDRNLYSFLGGTIEEAFVHAPNDLLKHVVIDYGREAGRHSFVLGGGYTKNDGILRYKKSFDPSGCVPFRKLKLIADRTEYDALVSTRMAQESASPHLGRTGEGYFPEYRR